MVNTRLRISAAAALLLASCGGGGSDAPAGPLSGEKVFAQDCGLCHIAAPPDSKAAKLPRPGPNLWGVYGRAAAQGAFAYSKAMRNANLVWDEATLHAFLTKPSDVVMGTQMAFAGEKDAAKRRAIIDYLKTMK